MTQEELEYLRNEIRCNVMHFLDLSESPLTAEKHAAEKVKRFEEAIRAEGEKEGQKNAVLRIREHSTYRSNLPEAGYYEVDAELLDEFDDDEQSLLSPATKESTENEKIARLSEIVQEIADAGEPKYEILTRTGSAPAPKEEK